MKVSLAVAAGLTSVVFAACSPSHEKWVQEVLAEMPGGLVYTEMYGCNHVLYFEADLPRDDNGEIIRRSPGLILVNAYQAGLGIPWITQKYRALEDGKVAVVVQRELEPRVPTPPSCPD